MKTIKINAPDLVAYFKHTSLNISSYLRQKKIPESMRNKISAELRRHLIDCEMCGMWDIKSEIIRGKCEDCRQGD